MAEEAGVKLISSIATCDVPSFFSALNALSSLPAPLAAPVLNETQCCEPSLLGRYQGSIQGGQTPLILAVALKRSAMVRALLTPSTLDRSLIASGAARRSSAAPPLCDAAVEMLASVLDVNAPNAHGLTAAMVAVESNDTDTLTLLMKHGGMQLDRQEPLTGRTALHWAAHIRSYGTLYLLSTAASAAEAFDANVADADGNTVLHVVARDCGDATPSPLHNLLRMDGIDVNAQNAHLRTPLHLAVIAGNVEAVRQLVKRPEIVLTVRDKRGHTPMEYCAASDPDLQKIAKLLREASGGVLGIPKGSDRARSARSSRRHSSESVKLLEVPAHEEPEDTGCSCSLL